MVTTAILALAAIRAFAEAPKVGSLAPGFAATDMAGQTVKLADFRGKYVVLEWTNRECPFVRKHYSSGNMQKTQEWAKDQGAVWLTVISSAPSQQGYASADEAKRIYTTDYWKGSSLLLDPDGSLGHMYNAKTSPHLFVIDPQQKLVYAGGIDNKRTPNVDDIPSSINYVKQALSELLANKSVSVPVSKPYGCSIKYAE